MTFEEARRQTFLAENSYQYEIKRFYQERLPLLSAELIDPSNDSEGFAILSTTIATIWFESYMLRFTAGESLENLREDLSFVISAHERAYFYKSQHEEKSNISPLYFSEIDDYERCLQLIGLCYLLHRRDELARLARLFDGPYAGRDTLYEDLLKFQLPDRFDLDELYHEDSYRNLCNSYYRGTSSEQTEDINKHLKNWYPNMAAAVWHDSHLDMNEFGTAGYFGYWAIEAAAMVYLLNLNDTPFRKNLFYPADLVDFARNTESTFNTSSNAPQFPARVAGGELCPMAGYWHTPARQSSRTYFAKGVLMPVEVGSSFEATIWQWSEDQ